RHQLLQPLVLILPLLPPLRCADTHPSILRLPRVHGVLAHPQFSPHFRRTPPRFHLFQCPNHLPCAILPLRHAPPFRKCENHISSCAELRNQLNRRCSTV